MTEEEGGGGGGGLMLYDQDQLPLLKEDICTVS